MSDIEPATIEEIKLAADQLKQSDGSISHYIKFRHMLTANIEKNLYNGAARDEGREALEVRDKLDETIFNITEKDVEDGSMEATNAFVKGILTENLAEQMLFVEEAEKAANGKHTDIKFQLRKLIDNPDKFGRFSTHNQQVIRDAAGDSFFENIFAALGLSVISNFIARNKLNDIKHALSVHAEAII